MTYLKINSKYEEYLASHEKGGYLRRAEYEHIGDTLEAGEQVNINHDCCPAGFDSKKRLYIKRTDDGTRTIAYCHHCEQSGSYGSTVYRTSKSKTTNSTARSGVCSTSNRLPSDYTGVEKEWSSAGRSWVYKYGITAGEIREYSIGYSDYYQRMVLPIYRDGKLNGYQLRKLETSEARDKRSEKYLTRAAVRPLFWVSKDLTTTNTLVITEDILSGIKCARFHPTVALLKASVSDGLIEWIAKQSFKKFIIFLDNDNRQVKQNQVILKNRLSLFGIVEIIHMNKDPKECSNAELKALLT